MRFNLDNPVFTALGKVVDCAWLSILVIMLPAGGYDRGLFHGNVLYGT